MAQNQQLTISPYQTPTFYATLKTSDGATPFEPTDLASSQTLANEGVDYPPASYSVYRSNTFNSSQAVVVPGFENVAFPTSAFIASATVTANDLSYNFKMTPDARLKSPFDEAAQYYVVFRVYPKTGNPIVWRRPIRVA